MTPRKDFLPVRACLFDMDGLLLDTEDIYTKCIDTLLAQYSRPSLPWSIKAKLQGRPGPEASAVFHAWAQLPITQDEYNSQYAALQRQHFPHARPLPGAEALLANLERTRWWDIVASSSSHAGHRVHTALATSSHRANFALKTAHLSAPGQIMSAFPPGPRRVLGDDPRVPPGRGKPLPDIYLAALAAINDTLPPGESPITPEECLVFEDSVPGVEAGRRAGMRVIWCPHPGLRAQYAGREAEVLAGRTGEAGAGVDEHQLGDLGDGWADLVESLEDFSLERYGIVVPTSDVDDDPRMQVAPAVAR